MTNIENEPIWIRKGALIFEEWASRAASNPSFFDELQKETLPDNYGYVCMKYFDALAREMDKAGILPTGRTNRTNR